MAFLSWLALGVGLLVVAPYFAHRLRRRRAEEQPFPAAALVPPAPPKARRRSRIEDRALLATRGAAVLALALLGATPFVRCSRLSLQRSGGASIAMAIVVDDSMSMRASAGGTTRFERARQGARELLASAREGDAVALVLAGDPPRVELGATTDLGAVRHAIDALAPSDRGTDLEGALALARGLLGSLPQVDRRIVLLSDMADGHSDGPPLAGSPSLPLWVALPEIAADRADCAVIKADQRGVRIHVTVVCSAGQPAQPGQPGASRDVVAYDAKGQALGHGLATGTTVAEATILLPSADAKPDHVRLAGGDAIAEDDTAPVVPEAARSAIAVVVDSSDEAVATGGAPIVEQALAALKLDVDTAPIPAFPDGVEELTGDLGVLLDDPPGLTPEQRHAMGLFLDRGGVVLLALGPHAASAPLGATLEPVLSRAVAWTDTAVHGADPASALGELGALGGLGASAGGLADLGASRRATLAREDAALFEPLVRWADGAPLVARRAVGRGEVWVVTLPFSVDASDFPLRSAFLALLSEWVSRARERAAPERSEVGGAWKYPHATEVTVVGPNGPLAVTVADGAARFVPPVVGTYRITVSGRTETRVAAPPAREVDLRPRSASAAAETEALGQRRASVDMSGPLALVLLGLVALEMALRLSSRRRLLAG
jgi:Mg-chelatase subunit ChlD